MCVILLFSWVTSIKAAVLNSYLNGVRLFCGFQCHDFPKTNTTHRKAAFSCLIVCQMAPFFVVSSLNRRSSFTPGFIPVHLTGMSDSSVPRGASPMSLSSSQLSGFEQSRAELFLVFVEQTGTCSPSGRIVLQTGGLSLYHTPTRIHGFASRKIASRLFRFCNTVCFISTDCHRVKWRQDKG